MTFHTGLLIGGLVGAFVDCTVAIFTMGLIFMAKE